jgi:hypothetical protein
MLAMVEVAIFLGLRVIWGVFFVVSLWWVVGCLCGGEEMRHGFFDFFLGGC